MSCVLSGQCQVRNVAGETSLVAVNHRGLLRQCRTDIKRIVWAYVNPFLSELECVAHTIYLCCVEVLVRGSRTMHANVTVLIIAMLQSQATVAN